MVVDTVLTSSELFILRGEAGIRIFSFRFHISSSDVPWFLPATDADAIPVLMQSTGKKFDELFEPLADQKFRIKPAAEPLFNLKK